MKRQSLDDFLEEMAKKPQTLGWDVVLAFDRNKTNYLLLQDYISRFGAASLFPPVDSPISPAPGVTHHLLGLQLDKPRLSFENAVITESRARCLMRTVGGRTIETTRPQGTTREEVKRLGIADGLVGPQLTMTINLRNAPGSVGSAGQVELDLAGNGATDFQLTGVDTRFEAVKLGEHLKQEIAKWSDKQKKFELSELRQNPGDALQPGKFVVLTRPAPGATRRDADDFGDGEVLVMVGLDNRQGTLPSYDEHIPYLLPATYSSNLLISYQQYVTRMVVERIKQLFAQWGGTFRQEVVGEFHRFVCEGGGISVPEVDRGDIWGFSFYCRGTYLPFSGIKLSLVDGAVRLEWSGESSTLWGKTSHFRDNPDEGPWVYAADFSANWSMVYDFRALLGEDEVSGAPVLKIESIQRVLDAGASIKKVTDDDKKCEDEFYRNIGDYFVDSCLDRLVFLAEKFEGVNQKIDAFRLNGLLFRDESVVVPEYISLPGDLTILGHLQSQGPQISPTEVNIAAERSHQFLAQGFNIRWSVTDPQDSDRARGSDPERVGTIDDSGLYTAPSAESFNHTFKRVIVTATDGSWTGKALVHLVAAPVSVFPRVNVVNLSVENDEGYLVWAASTNGAAMTWKITGNAGGRLAEADDPNVQEARRYFGPTAFPPGGTGQLEKVLRVDRVEVSLGTGAATVCEMLLSSAPIANYFFKYSAVGNGLQFEFWVTDDNGEESRVPEASTKWHKVSGLGQLNDSGLYTYSATGNDHYVVVAAFYEVQGVPIALWNYVIVPLPLATLLPSLESQP
ncbi:hypothetical protein KSS94_07620 [Pseudomonas fakonensis]|uniref:Uncharacterized protein n=1 Tax=Pseudomonas fakonensis TaxID=2842355 RepID=A0ABX8N9E9_9PSED|nr:hypothetical protein [Pseudomonas fakonensis]QXH52984.1 hypothetical protein KSS94_07620 [Pseudomonas fakonensis]